MPVRLEAESCNARAAPARLAAHASAAQDVSNNPRSMHLSVETELQVITVQVGQGEAAACCLSGWVEIDTCSVKCEAPPSGTCPARSQPRVWVVQGPSPSVGGAQGPPGEETDRTGFTPGLVRSLRTFLANQYGPLNWNQPAATGCGFLPNAASVHVSHQQRRSRLSQRPQRAPGGRRTPTHVARTR